MANQWGFADVNTLTNASWSAFLQYQKALYLSDMKQQGDYLKLIEGMVKQSVNYDSTPAMDEYGKEMLSDDGSTMTRWDVLDKELANAEGMFCGGMDCLDEESKVTAKMVGLLKQARNTYKLIYDTNRDAISFLTGDPDDPEDFGLTGRIKKIHANVLSGEGTQGAVDVLNDMGTQYKNWSGWIKKGTSEQYKKTAEDLSAWIKIVGQVATGDLDPYGLAPVIGEDGEPLLDDKGQPLMYPTLDLGDPRNNPELFSVGGHLQRGQTTDAKTQWRKFLSDPSPQMTKAKAMKIIGGQDLDPNDPNLNLGDPDTHPELFLSGSYLSIGDYDKALSSHAKYLNTVGEVAARDRLDQAKHMKQYGRTFKDKVEELKSIEVAGGASKLFVDGIRYSFTSPTWQTDINPKIMGSRKNLVADNIAQMLDKWAEGKDSKNWTKAKNEAIATLIYNFKKDNPLAIKDYEPTTEEVGRAAIQKYIGPMSDTQVRRLAEGETGIFGDDGMDFPGWKIWGKGEEGVAEDYFVKQIQLWQIADDMQKEHAMSGLPSNAQGTGNIPGSGTGDKFNMKSRRPSQSFIHPTTQTVMVDNNGFLKSDNGANMIGIDPDVNTIANANELDILMQSYNGAMLSGQDPSDAVTGVYEKYLSGSDLNFQINEYRDEAGATYSALLIGKADYLSSVNDSLNTQWKDVNNPNVPNITPADTSFLPDSDAPVDTSAVGYNTEALQALSYLEGVADSLDVTDFPNNNILDTLDPETRDAFVSSSESSVFKDQINLEIDAIFGEKGLSNEGITALNIENGLSSSDIVARYLNNRDDILETCPECMDDPFLMSNHFLNNYLDSYDLEQ